MSSHDKGQEREEPYEATSLMYGSEAAAGRATDPPTVTSPRPVAGSASKRRPNACVESPAAEPEVAPDCGGIT